MEFASPQKILNVFRSIRLGYLQKLFGFAFKHYPILSFAVGIYLFSVTLEILAMAAFMPLSEIASGRGVSPNNIVIKLLSFLHLNAQSPKYIFLTYIILFSMRFATQIIAERVLASVTTYRMPAQFMSLALSNVLQYEKISTLEKYSSGHLILLAGEEVHKACSIIATTIRFMSNALLIGLYYVMIYYFSPITGWGVLIFLGLSMTLSYGVFKKIHRLGILTTESSRTATSIFVDALNGVRSVRAFGAESYVLDKFQQEIVPHKRRIFQMEFFSFFGKTFPALALILAFGMFILISTQVNKIAFDYAFAVTLLIFLLRFFLAVGDTVNVFLKVLSDAKSAQDITDVVHDRYASKGNLATTKPSPVFDHIEKICLENICFSYTEENQVLEDVNLVFERGKSYAILGESGAGKSTILDLLLGFHSPTQGRISINDLSMSEYDEQYLRHHIVILGQETIIFNDTVRNNISYGKNITEIEMIEASHLAGVDDVIMNLPLGYDEMLQYRGTNLSGGQRQRIGIARALVRKPKVLVFDESMSALDPTTKEMIIENILHEYRNKIVIFVSHDVSIREKVDIVIELHKHTGSFIGRQAQATVHENSLHT